MNEFRFPCPSFPICFSALLPNWPLTLSAFCQGCNFPASVLFGALWATFGAPVAFGAAAAIAIVSGIMMAKPKNN
jgi:hypothetical protein